MSGWVSPTKTLVFVNPTAVIFNVCPSLVTETLEPPFEVVQPNDGTTGKCTCCCKVDRYAEGWQGEGQNQQG